MKKVVGKKQSDAGVVRVHLPWIEQQIANGVRHEAIVEHFAGMGFPMTVISFRTSLVRERAKVKEAEKKAREAAEAAGVRYEPQQAAAANQGQQKNNQSVVKQEIGIPKTGVDQVIERDSRPPLVIAAKPQRFKSSLDKDDSDDPAI
jgi:hypothetical protein